MTLGTERNMSASAIAAGFVSPPLAEVSLAVAFQPLGGLRVVGLSQLWETKFRDRFPVVEEQAPVQMLQERFEGVPGVSVSFQMLNTPPLPRLWFLDSVGGSELIQVQADWFARNWRDVGDGRPYPLIAPLIAAFETDFAKLIDFVEESELGSVFPTQAEITYINHIDETDLTKVLRLLERPPDGILADPEAGSLAYQYLLSGDGTPIARLYLQAVRAVHRATGKAITQLTITVRGAPIGEGVGGVLSFFELGAERALDAFIAATRSEMHARWGAA
jgi:uncharacterized protein (TIGR04255 family)